MYAKGLINELCLTEPEIMEQYLLSDEPLMQYETLAGTGERVIAVYPFKNNIGYSGVTAIPRDICKYLGIWIHDDFETHQQFTNEVRKLIPPSCDKLILNLGAVKVHPVAVDNDKSTEFTSYIPFVGVNTTNTIDFGNLHCPGDSPPNGSSNANDYTRSQVSIRSTDDHFSKYNTYHSYHRLLKLPYSELINGDSQSIEYANVKIIMPCNQGTLPVRDGFGWNDLSMSSGSIPDEDIQDFARHLKVELFIVKTDEPLPWVSDR